MGLDLTKLDIGALAGTANNGVGRLGLDVPDWGAYGKNYAAAKLAQQQLAQQYAQIESGLQQQQMQNQGAMDRQTLQGQQGMDLANYNNQFTASQNDLTRTQDMKKTMMEEAARQQQLKQQGQYQQGQLGVAQGNLDINKQQLGIDEQYKQGMLQNEQDKSIQDNYFKTTKAMADLKDQERNRIGSFGGVISIIAKNNPNALPGVIDYGITQGIFPKEVGEQLKQMPPEDIQSMGLMYASAADHATDYAKLAYGDTKKGNDTGGISIKENPDGTREISIGAENKVQATAQQNVVDTLKNLDSLEQITKDYDPKFLTAAGKIQSSVGSGLSWANLGSETEDKIKQMTGGTIDPQAAKKFSSDYQKFTGQVATFKMNFIKAMSGLSYTDKQMQAMEDAVMTENDSPSEFYGKAQALTNMMKATLKTQQDVAADKIPANTPEFQKAFDNRLQNNITKEIESKTIPGAMIDGEWTTTDEIQSFAKATKLSVSEVLKRKGVFQ